MFMRYSFITPRKRDDIIKDRARRIKIALDEAKGGAPSMDMGPGVESIGDDEVTTPIRVAVDQ